MEGVEGVYVSSALKFVRVARDWIGRGPMIESRDWIFVGYRARSGGEELWLSKMGTPLRGKPASVEAVEERSRLAEEERKE